MNPRRRPQMHQPLFIKRGVGPLANVEFSMNPPQKKEKKRESVIVMAYVQDQLDHARLFGLSVRFFRIFPLCRSRLVAGLAAEDRGPGSAPAREFTALVRVCRVP